MKISNLGTLNLSKKLKFVRTNWQTFLLMSLLLSAALVFSKVSAQNADVKQTAPTIFRIGERLTYNLSFDKFKNAGIAEIFVASRGKLSERDAVELQGRIKTTELVSAAFYLLDETRTTYVAADTGLPLYIRKTSNAGVLPKETINNYLNAPTSDFDLLTVIYQARNAGGIGTFSVSEDEKNYTIGFQRTIIEKFKNELGEFDTNVSTVQSQYFIERGITDVRINFTNDEARIPVLFRFKTAKGEFRAEISAIQMPEPSPTPTPKPIQSQTPFPTPKPTVTPAKYVDNEPLSPDLPFKLGETLEYRVTANGRNLGVVTVQVKERKQVRGQDSLLLTATVTEAQPNQQILNLNDSMQSQISPTTLSPFDFTARFGGLFNIYNQAVVFDQINGKAQVKPSTNLIDIPIGTHNLLSLAFAIRSFNLKPSLVVKNPVNDTRVAVLIGANASVFILRPSNAETITLNGEKISVQAISITTGNPQVDAMNLQPRIWLSNDVRRLPVRLILGSYQADLISQKIIPPK